MLINEAGLSIIKRCEGLRLHSYQDIGGIWTIGYGSTSKVSSGMTISEPEAEERLKNDVFAAEGIVTNCIDVPLSQNEFSALVSLCFNIKPSAFKQSTLVEMINLGMKKSASLQFSRWNHVKGVVVAGLTERREEERILYMTP